MALKLTICRQPSGKPRRSFANDFRTIVRFSLKWTKRSAPRQADRRAADRGENVIPEIQFSDITEQRVTAEQIEVVKARGACVIRNVFHRPLVRRLGPAISRTTSNATTSTSAWKTAPRTNTLASLHRASRRSMACTGQSRRCWRVSRRH